jgi:carboxypeptidase D
MTQPLYILLTIVVPFLAMVKEFKNLFTFNRTFWQSLDDTDSACGFTDFLNEWLQYPPKGVQPPSPSSGDSYGPCDIYDIVLDPTYLSNPCFYAYHLGNSCPYPVDPIRNPPSGGGYYYNGQEYFNHSDVKAAIHAPDVAWSLCKEVIFNGGTTDLSLPPSVSVLPSVIERSKRTVIISSTLDLVLPSNGTL